MFPLLFLAKLIPLGPLIYVFKHFQIWLRFRGDIRVESSKFFHGVVTAEIFPHKNIFAKSKLKNALPRGMEL